MYNEEKIIDSMSYIGGDMVISAMTPVRNSGKKRKIAAMVAAAIAFSFAVIPAAAGEGMYEVMYGISPYIAQKIISVDEECVDKGIMMKVDSMEIYGNSVFVRILLTDVEEDRIDSSCDLFDSYYINSSSASSGSCVLSGFDEETRTAEFTVMMTFADRDEAVGEKVTFGVRKIITSKKRYGNILPIDLSAIGDAKETQRIKNIRGAGGKGEGWYDDMKYGEYLIAGDSSFSPVDGVYVTATGFIDGKLHIQLYYEDILNTDNHGHINLVDENDNAAENVSVAFWDEDKKGSYEEIIYDVSPEEIHKYVPYGSFVTSDGATDGNWKVTFRIEE